MAVGPGLANRIPGLTLQWSRRPTASAPPSLRLLGAAHRGRDCDTRSRVSLLDAVQEAVMQPWCGATCSRTGGASLATVRSQALGQGTKGAWPTGRTSGNDREGEGHRSLALTPRDAGGASATRRLQRQKGLGGRWVSVHGKPTHPSSHPVYRGVLPRAVNRAERGKPGRLSGLCHAYIPRGAEP